MKINLLISLSFYLFINIFFLADLKSQINNTIVVKIGNSIITSVDIENEIITNLTINKIEITQANINNYKNIALKNLINNSIKKNEVEKYEITKSYRRLFSIKRNCSKFKYKYIRFKRNL